jgi:hypothetical protein
MKDAGLIAFETRTAWLARCGPGKPQPEPVQDADGKTPEHAMWMLNEIIRCRVEWSDDRLHRWVGYAQALLIMYGFLTLDDCRRIVTRA